MMRGWCQIIESVCVLAALAFLAGGANCISGLPDSGDGAYNNTTDATNGGAEYIGSQACGACHSGIGRTHGIHGHSQMLKPVLGIEPDYPSQATQVGVGDPPEGLEWPQIAYVIGGYVRKANFIDQDGYLLTTGYSGADTQFNLSFPASGTSAGFVAYESGDASRQEYEYSCFACHTTGPAGQNSSSPRFQDNRPGIAGTWQESGIQCEACHGPGSRHVPNPQARNLFVDVSARACGECHSLRHPSAGNADGGTIYGTGDGFIDNHQQWPELLASGGHAGFDCVTCHDPHVSSQYSNSTAFVRTCQDCHSDKNMGYHEGKQYVSGDYVEALSCVSCHMPLAAKSATSVVVGDANGRVGDTRTHIFRINTNPVGYTAMFAADMETVLKDGSGRAAVTVDFVCLRCHNTENGYPFRLTVRSASEVAAGIHGFD